MASNEDGAKTKKDRAGDKKASKSDTKGGTKGTSNIQDAFLASAFRAAAESEAEAAVEHRKNVLAHVGPDVFSASDYEAADPDDWKHTRGRDNFTSAEVQIAKRCHGFHMELLKLDRTPIGSHYELIHYDVPVLGSDHIVKVTGCVSKPLELTVDDIKSRPQMTHPVFMACAGTGRSMLAKRFWTHAPWGPDCIGCSEWTGCSLADVLREAGPEEGAAQVIFTGADRGLEGGKVQYFQRSLTLEQCLKGHVMLVHGMNGNDLTPAHGFPVRIVVPGWYGESILRVLSLPSIPHPSSLIPHSSISPTDNQCNTHPIDTWQGWPRSSGSLRSRSGGGTRGGGRRWTPTPSSAPQTTPRPCRSSSSPCVRSWCRPVSPSRPFLPSIPQSHPSIHPHAHTDLRRGTHLAHLNPPPPNSHNPPTPTTPQPPNPQPPSTHRRISGLCLEDAPRAPRAHAHRRQSVGWRRRH